MKLPQFLLKLLPMWEYICPKCRKTVKVNSHQCPYCGEKYPFALRVPPSFLKDPKKLEDFVHKHVFPRVDEATREYLTQYFTELFSDGFESGDFSAWTSTTNSPAVSSAQAHHGTYSMRCTGNDLQYATKVLGSTYSHVFVRVYVYAHVLPWAQYYAMSVVQAGNSANYAYATRIEIQNVDGTNCKFRLYDGARGGVLGSTVVQLDTWYCVELERRSGSGSSVMYIDGVQEATRDYSFYDADRVDVGGSSLDSDAYFDCVVAADAYIGAEVSSVLKSVFDPLSMSDAVNLERLVIASDTLAAGDSILGHRQFSVDDSVGEADAEATLKLLDVSDSMVALDSLSIPDSLRSTIDSICLAEGVKMDKMFAVGDSVYLVEVAVVGAGSGDRRTRLFLVLGNVAVQLTK